MSKKIIVFLLIVFILVGCKNNTKQEMLNDDAYDEPMVIVSTIQSTFHQFVKYERWYYPFASGVKYDDKVLYCSLFQSKEDESYLIKVKDMDLEYKVKNEDDLIDFYQVEVNLENYTHITDFDVNTILEKPLFEYSAIEQEILVEIEKLLMADVDEFISYEKKWSGANIYIWDFNLNYSSVSIWIYLSNGEIISYPFGFEFNNDKLLVFRGMNDKFSSFDSFSEREQEALNRIHSNPLKVIKVDGN